MMQPASLSMESRSWKQPDELVYEDLPPGADPLRYQNMLKLYPQWHAQARCLGTSDTLFFGTNEPDVRPPYTLGDIKRARLLCADCPVARQCLSTALSNREEYGVWAGSTRKQRKRMLSRIDTATSNVDDEVEQHLASIRVEISADVTGATNAC